MTLHSVHVDRIDAVTAAIAALEAGSPARVNAVDETVEILHDLVRDGMCDAYLIVQGIPTDTWDTLDGFLVNSSRKRRYMRTVAGQPIVTVDFVKDGAL